MGTGARRTVLRVEFRNDADLAASEVIEEHKGYREWCIPAEIINTRATVTLLSQEEVEELEDGSAVGIPSD